MARKLLLRFSKTVYRLVFQKAFYFLLPVINASMITPSYHNQFSIFHCFLNIFTCSCSNSFFF
ncbi:hypothetical protein A7P25_24565 [Achromobacter xylosoxidans]|nr:hypothetical protein A7P25_24565 [Achromobacter xylosoxidans]